jgi:hypothetical protein
VGFPQNGLTAVSGVPHTVCAWGQPLPEHSTGDGSNAVKFLVVIVYGRDMDGRNMDGRDMDGRDMDGRNMEGNANKDY